jgi:hypothetical protein
MKQRLLTFSEAKKRFPRFDEHAKTHVLDGHLKLDKILVFEGDTEFELLVESDIVIPKSSKSAATELGSKKNGPWVSSATPAQYLIVNGNLTLEKHFSFLESERVGGVLVLGNLTADSMQTGDSFIHITGNLNLRSHYHSPRPSYENGVVSVDGVVSVPVTLQEDYNPTLLFNLAPGTQTKAFGPGELLEFKKRRFFEDGHLIDVQGLVTFLKKETLKPKEQQKNFDWYTHLSRSSVKYSPGEREWFNQDVLQYPEESLVPLLNKRLLENAAQLRTVEIIGVPFEQFPEGISCCAQLERLELRKVFSHIDTIPDLSQLTQLKSLMMSDDSNETQTPARQTLVQDLMRHPMASLEYLEISSFGLDSSKGQGPLDFNCLRGIGAFESLQGIYLMASHLVDLPDDFFYSKT